MLEGLARKSQSQRLRAVLYVRWEQKDEPKPKFEDYYYTVMEAFIKHVMTKLTNKV